MTMFTGLFMLLASASQQAGNSPVIPAFFTGERLYEICTGEDLGQCWMYVAGVLDGVFAAEAAADTRSICAARLTNRDAAERVTEFLRENTNFQRKAAAVGVKAALQSSLRCGADDMTSAGNQGTRQ